MDNDSKLLEKVLSKLSKEDFIEYSTRIHQHKDLIKKMLNINDSEARSDERATLFKNVGGRAMPIQLQRVLNKVGYYKAYQKQTAKEIFDELDKISLLGNVLATDNITELDAVCIIEKHYQALKQKYLDDKKSSNLDAKRQSLGVKQDK